MWSDTTCVLILSPFYPFAYNHAGAHESLPCLLLSRRANTIKWMLTPAKMMLDFTLNPGRQSQWQVGIRHATAKDM